MRYCIFLTFDDNAQQALHAFREDLARHAPGVPRLDGKMGPHLTLAVFDAERQESVPEKFEKLTNGLRTFALALNDVGSFEGRKKVLYVAPLPSQELQTCYERTHAFLAPSYAMVPAYRDPSKWTPHVTLTKGIGGRAFQKAFAYAMTHWSPMNAAVARVGLINVQRTLEILASQSFHS